MKKKLLALLLAGVMVFGLLAGCSGGGQDTPDQSSAPSQAAEPEDTPEAGAPEGGSDTLIVGLQGDPASFNPTGAPDDWGFYVAENLFSRLVKLNWNGEYLPDLASTWDIAEDGLSYTFHLKENVKWHDGEPFSSADVKWTFDTVVEQGGYLSSYLGNVTSIDAPDDNTVVFQLSAPDPALLSNLSFLGAFILPKHLYEGQDWLTCDAAVKTPVGTGPFMFESYQQGVAITLAANPDYYDGAPTIGKLVYQIIPDGNTAIQSYNNGELDVLGIMAPASQVPGLLADPDSTVTQCATFGRYYYGFNFRSADCSKPEVRQAIAKAIDRADVVEKAFGVTGKLCEGFYTPTVAWAYNDQVKIPAYDAAEAEQLLVDAGYTKNSDGYYMTLTMATFNLDPFTNIAAVMQAYLKEIGIDLKIDAMEAGAYMQIGAEGEGYDLFAMGGGIGPDPSTFAQRVGTGTMLNFSGYSNSEVDELFEKGLLTSDQDERAEYYKRIQEIVGEDLPIIPLSEDITTNVYKSYLSGLPYDECVDKTSMDEMTYVTFNK